MARHGIDMREISRQQVQVLRAIELAKDHRENWITAREISESVKDVAPRTVRNHLTKMHDLGILERMEVFDGYQYRLAPPRRRTPDVMSHLAKLEEAASVFGL